MAGEAARCWLWCCLPSPLLPAEWAVSLFPAINKLLLLSPGRREPLRGTKYLMPSEETWDGPSAPPAVAMSRLRGGRVASLAAGPNSVGNDFRWDTFVDPPTRV